MGEVFYFWQKSGQIFLLTVNPVQNPDEGKSRLILKPDQKPIKAQLKPSKNVR
jgi:hypothetical protein